MTTGRLLARNSALNLIGHAAPLVVAVLAIPPLVKGLGAERFGVLSLAWATIGYFGLFEFGLGRALTQAVARRLGSEKTEELAGVTRTALGILLALGVLGGVALVIATRPLVSLLDVPISLRQEALLSFLLLAASLPFVLGTVGLRGIMEAHQHFGLATALRIPLGVLSFVAPLAVLPFSRSLVPSVAALVVGRILGFAAHAIACARRYPYLSKADRIDRASVRELLHFGGWTTVSNLVSPLMVYADRFVISAVIGLAAVTAYVTPLEVVVKVLLISGAMSGAFLPALSSTFEAQRERMLNLYERSLRANMLVTFPIVLAIVAVGDVALRLWMGASLPIESGRIIQWLAIGVFVTAVAQAPHTALQSAGRPDLIAKLHLIEVPIYAAMLATLLRWRGLEGAAMAWTARTILDAAGLLWLARRRVGTPVFPKIGGAWSLLAMIAVLALGFQLTSVAMKATYLVIGTAAFVALAWRGLLSERERAALGELLMRTRIGAHAGAAVAAILLLGAAGCEPCSPTFGCGTPPRISVTGQILDESGLGIRSRVELRRESGIEFQPVSVETGSNGVFDIITAETAGGTAVARLIVTPQGQRPFVVSGVSLPTFTMRGDGKVLPPWSRPTLPYAIHFARASNNSSIEGATIRFQRTSGPELMIGGSQVAEVTDVTGPAGYSFLFREVTVDSTGTVAGILSVQAPGLATPYTQTIAFNVVPQFRLRHGEQTIHIPGL